jgi:hypothetical protein
MNYKVKGIDNDGNEIIESLTIPEILGRHGLDFSIIKRPLISVEEGEQYISPYYGLYNSKTNECINSVKEGYTVSQNIDVVEMVLKGIEKFGTELMVSKAGSINGGRRVFMQLEIEGDSKVGDDIIKRYVTVIDSNDGSTGLSVGIGDLTMSCQNQFFRFYKSGDAKFRHTATLNEKIKSIPSLIEIALDESMRQINVYRKFVSTPVTQMLAHKMVKSVLGYDKVITSTEELAKLTQKSLNIMDSLYSHIDKETEQKGMNLWGLHSGITSWTTHERKAPKRDNGKWEDLLVGTSYKKNQASYEFATNMLSHA